MVRHNLAGRHHGAAPAKGTTNGIRFYLEFTDKSKRRSGGNVVAAFVLNGIYRSSGRACYEAIAALFDRPNAPVAGTGAALDYLRERCKRISEAKARAIHPMLFQRLDTP